MVGPIVIAVTTFRVSMFFLDAFVSSSIAHAFIN